ncbi:hypothetical protein SARC_01581 [Sphaeroforma arctica JP610]|uniref:DUF4874 domain-containing protein n=1 Tax=Sphaeroforma arctica JP610 TaxID=667725 RepID=A0A0L0GBH1_9EUKA|nr:hypothetical protein SARC_01581 [Sphaeroforma arctica JP610]KNC86259.1 hypothetical protein SARC_01581 [Sphaeroforma arctica JP610]|eukprot:XP_014160161.1 hypothetical protein SARC_01581 [Sphaeroforma arctica JP610]
MATLNIFAMIFLLLVVVGAVVALVYFTSTTDDTTTTETTTTGSTNTAADFTTTTTTTTTTGALTNRSCTTTSGGGGNRRMPRLGLGVYAGQEAKGLDVGFEWRYYSMAELSSPTTRGEYDWTTLEKDLAGAKSRGRPMVVRIQDQSVTNSGDYQKSLLPPYVSQPNKFVGTRIAYLQAGWGFWSESHLYHDGTNYIKHGVNYPSKEYQAKFVDHFAGLFKCLTFSFSIDGALSGLPLDDLRYGVFNDSLTAKGSSSQDTYYTKLNFAERNKTRPSGGEFPDSIKTPFGMRLSWNESKSTMCSTCLRIRQREDPNWDQAVAAVMQT